MPKITVPNRTAINDAEFHYQIDGLGSAQEYIKDPT